MKGALQRRYVNWNLGSSSPAGFLPRGDARFDPVFIHSLHLLTRLGDRSSFSSSFCALPAIAMSSRHRTRKDSYAAGYWQPNDSDSDRPRQTMAATQRHNVDQLAEPSRKHRSSRRADAVNPLDPSATYSRHKSSSKDRSSSTNYYGVPQPSNPAVQYQSSSQNAQYELRAYVKNGSDKRSPQLPKEKDFSADEAKYSRSAHRSRQPNPTSTAYTQLAAQPVSYAAPYPQSTHDPTSSSRHRRDREKDRTKTSNRDPDRVRAHDPATEKSEDRERRRRREKEREREKEKERQEGKERSSKDRYRERYKDRDGRIVDARPPDASSTFQAPYAQAVVTAQKSADKTPAGYPVRASDTINSNSLFEPVLVRVGISASSYTVPSGNICDHCYHTMGWLNVLWARSGGDSA